MDHPGSHGSHNSDLRTQQLDAIGRATGTRDVLRKQLQSPQGTDLSAILGFIDAQTGSKFAQQAPKQLSPQQRAAALNQLAQQDVKSVATQIAARKKEESETAKIASANVKTDRAIRDERRKIDKIGRDIANKEIAQTISLRGVVALEERSASQKKGRDQAEDRFKFNLFEKNEAAFLKEAKLDIEGLGAAQSARVLLEQGTSVADEILKGAMLELAKEKRKSDADVRRVSGSKSVFDSVSRVVNKAVTGQTLLETDRDDMKLAIDALQKLNSERIVALAERRATKAGLRTELITAEEFLRDLAAREIPGLTLDEEPPQGPAPQGQEALAQQPAPVGPQGQQPVQAASIQSPQPQTQQLSPEGAATLQAMGFNVTPGQQVQVLPNGNVDDSQLQRRGAQ